MTTSPGQGTPPPGADDDLYERLAAIEHERWASWQRYLHSKCTVQIATDRDGGEDEVVTDRREQNVTLPRLWWSAELAEERGDEHDGVVCWDSGNLYRQRNAEWKRIDALPDDAVLLVGHGDYAHPSAITRLATALGVSLDPDDPDPVGRLVEAAGKAREVQVVSAREAGELPGLSRVVRCNPENGMPHIGYTVREVEHENLPLGDGSYRVLYRAPAPAPAALAVGEVVESAADLDRRASVGTIVEDASGDIDKRGPGGWRYTELAYPVTVVRSGGES